MRIIKMMQIKIQRGHTFSLLETLQRPGEEFPRGVELALLEEVLGKERPDLAALAKLLGRALEGLFGLL